MATETDNCDVSKRGRLKPLVDRTNQNGAAAVPAVGGEEDPLEDQGAYGLVGPPPPTRASRRQPKKGKKQAE